MKLQNLILLASLVFLISCGKDVDSNFNKNLYQGNAFFQNSLRKKANDRTPNSRSIVRMIRKDGTQGCTGFYVRNSTDSVLIMSARHCMKYAAADWCYNGGTVKDWYTGEKRNCIGLIAASTKLDAIIFEFDGSLPKHSLSLGNFPVKKNLRLEMLGFPVDKYAPKSLSIVQNCWIRKNLFSSYPSKTLIDQGFGHNCSTYGGNSGGPMILEGTDIAIGLPNAYHPKHYGNSSSESFVEGINFSLLISKNSHSIKNYGITIINKLPIFRIKNRSIPLVPGLYKSKELKDWVATIKPIYNTNSRLTKVDVWWRNLKTQKRSYSSYVCKNEVCSKGKAGASKKNLNHFRYDSFSYGASGNEQRAIFKIYSNGYY